MTENDTKTKIPYYFSAPVPLYFKENGWLESENMFKFIHWAFSKCQTRAHKCVKYGREITFQPYEFMAGRLTSHKECFLTENVFRNQLILLERGGTQKVDQQFNQQIYMLHMGYRGFLQKR